MPLAFTYDVECLVVLGIESLASQVKLVLTTVTWTFYLRLYGIKRGVTSNHIFRTVFLTNVVVLEPAASLVAFLSSLDISNVLFELTNLCVLLNSLCTEHFASNIIICQGEVWFKHDIEDVVDTSFFCGNRNGNDSLLVCALTTCRIGDIANLTIVSNNVSQWIVLANDSSGLADFNGSFVTARIVHLKDVVGYILFAVSLETAQ